MSLLNEKSESEYGTSTHDNKVSFSGAKSINYWWLGWDITTGQPMETVSFERNVLDVVAGRKASNEVAAAFSNGLGIKNFFGLKKIEMSVPNELNFFVTGEITFYFPSGDQYTCPDFRIGQGHTRGRMNNWWVASSDCVQAPATGHLRCCCGRRGCVPSLDSPILKNFAIEITKGANQSDFTVTEWSQIPF